MLMFVNLVLSSVFGVYLLRAVMKNIKPTLPIACVWVVPSDGAASNAVISVVGTIAVIAGNAVIFALGVWYLHSKSQRWLKGLQVVGMLFLMGIAIGATIRVVVLSQAFGSPSVPLSDNAEKVSVAVGNMIPTDVPMRIAWPSTERDSVTSWIDYLMASKPCSADRYPSNISH